MPLVKVSRYHTGEPDGGLEIKGGRIVPFGGNKPLEPIMMSLFLAEAGDDWFPVEPSLSKLPANEEGYILVPPTSPHAYLKAFATINSSGYSSVVAEPDRSSPDYKPEDWTRATNADA